MTKDTILTIILTALLFLQIISICLSARRKRTGK